MIVRIQNEEPMWVRYTLCVQIPDDTPKSEIEDVAMEQVYNNRFELEGPGEPHTTIDGMDQEFEIIDVLS
jgi:hypothetical protein